jgi:metal-dependent amidase/aminoacylase/carboxypeptidase family protein
MIEKYKEGIMLNRAMELQDKLQNFRRDFHKFPELGFQEYRTSTMVAEVLTSLGCQVSWVRAYQL